MILRRGWMALYVMFLITAGCDDGGGRRLAARGTVTVMTPSARSGFSFPTETLLYDETTAPPNATWGHCDIRVQGNGRPDIVSIGLGQGGTDAGADMVARFFRMRFDDPRPDSRQGRLELRVGSRPLNADIGAACATRVITYDVQARVAQLQATCQVMDGTDRIDVSADLTMTGCRVE